MKIGAAFPTKWLKAEDLGGKSHLLTIAKVVMEQVGTEDSPEEKPVMFFVGKSKGIVLNKTNATSVSLHYGDDTDNWTNKPVQVFPDKTMFGGKMVDCIRMRVEAPAATPGEDIPF